MIQYTAAQKEAITTLDQNLQIIACAGSGKTQVIAQRMVEILKQDGVKPKQLMAFTYTEKAAAELKSRVLRLCREQIPGLTGMAELYIGTIHGWCLHTIQEYIYQYQKFSVITEMQLKLLIDRHFDQLDAGLLNLSDQVYDRNMLINIMNTLRETTLNGPIPETHKHVLDNYENLLREHAYFDFTMMMTEALKQLQDDTPMQHHVKDHIRYLIVDEYQDVNPVQELIIRAIYNQGCNICVVGDDDQTIYQWRGSDLRYILDFEQRYDDVKQVTLDHNFRSSPGIVDLAHGVIQHNNQRLDKQMKAAGDQRWNSGDMICDHYNSKDEEITAIVNRIKQLRGMAFTEKGEQRGLDYGDMVILLRKWAIATDIIPALEVAEIPFVVGGGSLLFDTDEVQAAVGIFRYITGEIEHPLELAKLWQNLSDQISLEQLAHAIGYLDRTRPDEDTFYSEFILQDIFWSFLSEGGITESLFGVRGEMVFYNLGMFSKVIHDFETINFTRPPLERLDIFLQFLDGDAKKHYSEGWLERPYHTPNAVMIMTIFQSKGLEFPVVFLPALNKGYLPTRKYGGKKVWHYLPAGLVKDQNRFESSLEDERRLFYVAVTRSQKMLYLSRAYRNKFEQQESPFLKESRRSDFIISDKQEDYSGRDHTTPTPGDRRDSMVLNFSVLKNFFECPYRFKLAALYGFSSPLSIRIGYGNSIHNVLMELHKNALDGMSYKPEDLDPLLDTHIHIPYANSIINEVIREKSKQVVTDYIKYNQRDFQHIEYVEQEIQFDVGEDIIINGRIDLVKKKDLAGQWQTAIIDFKSAEDAQTYDVSMEQLALYAVGYEALSGEKADLLELYNLDENAPHRRVIKQSDQQVIKDLIQKSADQIKGNQFCHTTDKQQCKKCFFMALCGRN